MTKPVDLTNPTGTDNDNPKKRQHSSLWNNIPWEVVSWLVIILLPLIWLWPRLLNPAFEMIDDPHDLKRLLAMKQDFFGWLKTDAVHGEIGEGRFRPMYWLLRFVIYFLPAQLNPAGWIYIHYINLAVSLTLFFLLLTAISKKSTVGLLGTSLWIFNTNTIANYIRLATQEVWQVLWVGSLLITGFSILNSPRDRNTGWLKLASILTLFLLYFTKETSLILFPFSITMLCLSLVFKQKRKEWGQFVFVNLIFVSIYFLLAPNRTGYASNYQPSLEQIRNNLASFFYIQWHYLFLILLGTYLWRLLKYRKNLSGWHIEKWQFALLILGLAFFVIYLPWKVYVRRYLLVTDFLLSGFMALELGYWMLHARRIYATILGLFCLLAMTLSTAQLPMAIQSIYESAFSHTKGTVHALEWLCQKAEKGSAILSLELEPELTGATVLYTQYFFQRKDMPIYSLSDYAVNLQNAGYNVVPIQQITDEILERMDYIFWDHRGRTNPRLELFNLKIFHAIIQSSFRNRLSQIYSDVQVKNGIKEGPEILKLSRAPNTA
ncbi:MAG: hypothetical protein NC930_04090 [Candidatus Omnitrophica bacterium]|nr:hypothetical protein [Candidatus Omnitrophota bacterium]